MWAIKWAVLLGVATVFMHQVTQQLALGLSADDKAAQELIEVVKASEKGIISRLDPQAFVVVSDTLEVMGQRIGNQPHW